MEPFREKDPDGTPEGVFHGQLAGDTFFAAWFDAQARGLRFPVSPVRERIAALSGGKFSIAFWGGDWHLLRLAGAGCLIPYARDPVVNALMNKTGPEYWVVYHVFPPASAVAKSLNAGDMPFRLEELIHHYLRDDRALLESLEQERAKKKQHDIQECMLRGHAMEQEIIRRVMVEEGLSEEHSMSKEVRRAHDMVREDVESGAMAHRNRRLF